MGVGDVLFDNPILVKHLRSRLRPGQALPWAVIVLVLCAGATWVGHEISWVGNPSAVTAVLGLQILILLFGGSSQMTASLGGARESGILDFHRVSPLPPAMVALGFFLGAPIREYALAAISLPFALFSAFSLDPIDPWRGVAWFAKLEVAVLTTTWIVHAITMLGCLTRRKPRGSMQGTIVAIGLLLLISYFGSIGIYLGSRWLLDEEPSFNLFGRMIPWLAWLLIYEVPLLGFVALAVVRKMRAERTHSFTKPQALACMATLTLLVIGGTWDVARLLEKVPPIEPTPADGIMLGAVYLLSGAAIVLAVTITPNAGEYRKGVRRALHQGRRRPGPWSDSGSNRAAVFSLCALVLIGATAAVNIVGRQPTHDPAQLAAWGYQGVLIERAKQGDEAWLRTRQSLLSRPIAIGVLTVAHVGLGFQYFSLRTRRSGPVLLGLFLFTTWLAPVLAGAILGLSGPNRARAITISALSPLLGIVLSSGLGELPGPDAIQIAALAPPITFAFVFNFLLVVTQRQVDRLVLLKEKGPAPAEVNPLA